MKAEMRAAPSLPFAVFSITKVSAVVLLLAAVASRAVAASSQKAKIGQAGSGTGSMAEAPHWLQERAPHGLYFPLHHRSKLRKAHREANPEAIREKEGERERMLQDVNSPFVSWDLDGESRLPPFAFYTSVAIGANQQPFNVLLDTGSFLLWVQCECRQCANSSTSLSPVPLNAPLELTNGTILETCRDSVCETFRETVGSFDCVRNGDPYCRYAAGYLDGSASVGYIVTEQLTVVLNTGEVLRPAVSLGCGVQQSGNLFSGFSVFDGLLGLGRESYALVETLSSQNIISNTFSVCLEGEGQGGHLLLGRTSLPEGAVYTPLPTTGTYPGFWSAVLRAVTVNGNETINVGAGLGLEVILDTGSSATLLPTALHMAIFSAVFPILQAEGAFNKFPNSTCLGIDTLLSALELAQFNPPIVLNFDNADIPNEPARMEIPFFNFMVGYGQVQANPDVSLFCLDSIGVDSTDNATLQGFAERIIPIIGAPWLRNFDILHDGVNQRIGWIPLNCTTGASLDSSGSNGETVFVFPSSTNPPANGTVDPISSPSDSPTSPSSPPPSPELPVGSPPNVPGSEPSPVAPSPESSSSPSPPLVIAPRSPPPEASNSPPTTSGGTEMAPPPLAFGEASPPPPSSSGGVRVGFPPIFTFLAILATIFAP